MKKPKIRPASRPSWIWYPSQRTLANTFVLFRRKTHVRPGLESARGWISADSRYLLNLNNERVQWGPAPCDPRWLDKDPVDLTSVLRQGENVLASTVLFYGHPEGTWPAGKPLILCGGQSHELRLRAGG